MEIITPCAHDNFDADVRIRNLKALGSYWADMKIKCVDCGLPFQFVGGEISEDHLWMRSEIKPMEFLLREAKP